jgi:hypothetical protein
MAERAPKLLEIYTPHSIVIDPTALPATEIGPLGMQGERFSTCCGNVEKYRCYFGLSLLAELTVVENMDSQPNTARTTLLFKATSQLLQSVSRRNTKG